MTTYLGDFFANRPSLSCGCFAGSNFRGILPGYQCNRECSDLVITSRFSRRLSVLMPFLWWTISEGKSLRPKSASTINRCSLMAVPSIKTRRYPYTLRWCFECLSDISIRFSGWVSQYFRLASAIFWRCSGVLGVPAKWALLFLRSIPNLIKRFLTVFGCTPKSLAIDCKERHAYSLFNHSGSSSLLMPILYHSYSRCSTWQYITLITY